MYYHQNLQNWLIKIIHNYLISSISSTKEEKQLCIADTPTFGSWSFFLGGKNLNIDILIEATED